MSRKPKSPVNVESSADLVRGVSARRNASMASRAAVSRWVGAHRHGPSDQRLDLGLALGARWPRRLRPARCPRPWWRGGAARTRRRRRRCHDQCGRDAYQEAAKPAGRPPSRVDLGISCRPSRLDELTLHERRRSDRRGRELRWLTPGARRGTARRRHVRRRPTLVRRARGVGVG